MSEGLAETRIEGTKRSATDESLMVRGIDLSYLGVCNIWNVDLGRPIIVLLEVYS